MKTFKPFLLLVICIAFNRLHAQTYQYIDRNDVSAPIFSDGSLFWDPLLEPITFGFHEYYEFFFVTMPVDEMWGPPNANFATTSWLSGIDDMGQLHVAANTYRQSGNDFWPGPIANDYGIPEYTDTYDRVWKVDKSQIDDHIANWNTPGYIMPAEIADWPGSGNIANGEAAILAPYYDYNANSVYDPENGDYPVIRGDQAIYFMFNDVADTHTESGGLPFGFEIHGLAYEINDPLDTALNQSLFINYQIINRSALNYNDVRYGIFDDFDLGAYDDDYIGCDTLRNLFFGYNGDLADGPTSPNYGYLPPALGCKFLNQSLKGFISFYGDDDSIGTPSDYTEFNNYLHSTWLNGTPLTMGGNGYGGAAQTNYIYSGDPNDITGWSEFTEGNSPSDRRGMGYTGPFYIGAGDTICVDLVFAYAKSHELPSGIGSVAKLYENADHIQTYFDDAFPSCDLVYARNENYQGISANEQPDLHFVLFPNPAKNIITIQLRNSALQSLRSIELINTDGQLIKQINSIESNQTEIDISDLTKGIYLVKIIYETGEVAVSNFVKFE